MPVFVIDASSTLTWCQRLTEKGGHPSKHAEHFSSGWRIPNCKWKRRAHKRIHDKQSQEQA
jgi:hypothetical protein